MGRKKLPVLLLLGIFLLTGCDVQQKVNEMEAETETNLSGIEIYGDFFTREGIVEKTYTPDFDETEWADTPEIVVYVKCIELENQNLKMIENELNHRLHESGYAFHVTFLMAEMEEMINGESIREILTRREEAGQFVDLYLTGNYAGDVEAGVLLDLTDFLYSEEGKPVYEHFDELIWSQLKQEDGRIYGVSVQPSAILGTEEYGKFGYAYTDQIAEYFEADVPVIVEALTDWEELFAAMEAEDVAPVELEVRSPLMLSRYGYEAYGDIVAVSHGEEDWEAVDLFEDGRMVEFYKQLGELMEQGNLTYNSWTISYLNLPADNFSSEQYQYIFLKIRDDMVDTSYYININLALQDDEQKTMTTYLIPEQRGYIYEKLNSSLYVINSRTEYPEECQQLLKLLVTDDDIKMLLKRGIEGWHYYVDESGLLIFETAGFFMNLGVEYDERFMSEECDRKFTEEYDALNYGVTEALSLSHPCDWGDLSETYQTCRDLIYSNALIFLGYYGDETEQKLEELHQGLLDAGYQELIDAVNSLE